MVMIHKQTNKHTRTYKTQVRKGQSVQKTELKQTDGQTNGQTDAGYWCLTSLNTAEMISDKARLPIASLCWLMRSVNMPQFLSKCII